MFETMFYRTSLWLHSHRVSWLVEELIPVAKKHFKTFNPRKSIAIALVHDDAEIVTGDYQAGHKAIMSKAQLAKIKKEETSAIRELLKRYPAEVEEFVYSDLLYDAMEWRSLEAQVVVYADKLDAYCESIHEVLGGNISFIRAVIFYNKMLANFEKKYPKLQLLLKDQDSPLTNLDKCLNPMKIKISNYKVFNKPHTKQSIKALTEFPFYNIWRKITIQRFGNEGLKVLIEQKEFLSKIFNK